jgi:hypothetical protein
MHFSYSNPRAISARDCVIERLYNNGYMTSILNARLEFASLPMARLVEIGIRKSNNISLNDK